MAPLLILLIDILNLVYKLFNFEKDNIIIDSLGFVVVFILIILTYKLANNHRNRKALFSIIFSLVILILFSSLLHNTNIIWDGYYAIHKDKFKKCEKDAISIKNGKVNICEIYDSSSETINVIYDSSNEIEKNELDTSEEWKNTVLKFKSGFGYSKYSVSKLGNNFYEVNFNTDTYTMKPDDAFTALPPNAKGSQK
jgi:hypothetical protein